MSELSELAAAGVQYLRVLWCDNANVIRGRAVRTTRSAGADVHIAAAQMALPVTADTVVPGAGLGPVGEVRLAPDWRTLQVLPYAPQHAMVLADLQLEGGPWSHCPRTFLNGQVARLAQHGLSVQAAFENEFYLLRRTEDGYAPADQTVYAATEGMNAHLAFTTELTEALEAQGVQVEQYHPESGPGQQELSVRPAAPLESADRQVVFRETVRGVARRHGLVASFLPKVFEGAAGSGCHLNLSLWQGPRNVTGDADQADGLSRPGRSFLAGVLAHLPGLCALTVPTPNSYRRIRPQAWAGAYRAWGYANREVALRASRAASGAATRFELKTADASANPYLALGAVIAAGVDGLERELSLPPEVTCDPDTLGETERAARGLTLLPRSLEEALTALEADQTLLRALGPERARAYLAVRRAEAGALSDLSLPDELLLLAERY